MQNLIGGTYQANSRRIDSSLHSVSGLIVAILMKNQALGGTGFRQIEFKGGVDPVV